MRSTVWTSGRRSKLRRDDFPAQCALWTREMRNPNPSSTFQSKTASIYDQLMFCRNHESESPVKKIMIRSTGYYTSSKRGLGSLQYFDLASDPLPDRFRNIHRFELVEDVPRYPDDSYREKNTSRLTTPKRPAD